MGSLFKKTKTKTINTAGIKDPAVKGALDAIKESMEIGDGNRPNANPLDKKLTFRDMIDAGVMALVTKVSAYGPGVEFSNPGIVNTTPPPPVSGLTASGAVFSILLDWDPASYSNHSYTEIWRSTTDDLGAAIRIGTATAFVYADPAEANTGYYYWARFISAAGIPGPWNAVAGTYGATVQNPAYVLDVLTGAVTESQLYTALQDRINLIDTPTTGLVDKTAQLVVDLDTVKDEAFAAREGISETVLTSLTNTQDAFNLHWGHQSWREAVSYVDPDTAEIRLYAVEGLRTETEASLSTVSATLDAQEATINLKASKTYVDGLYNAILTSFEPVHTWNFDNTSDGFTGVNATLTTGASAVTVTPVTTGDSGLEKTGLSYAGVDNDNVRLMVKRTGGAGWTGKIYWSTAGHGFTEGYYKAVSAPTNDAELHLVSVSLRTPTAGGTDYTDSTITGIKVVLGNTTADTFEIDFIEIGKSAIEQLLLDDLDLRVTQAEIDIDGNTAAITLKADDTRVDGINDRLTAAEGEIVVNAGNIALKASQADFNTLTSRVDTAEVDIDATTGAITFTTTSLTEVNDTSELSAEALLEQLIMQNELLDGERVTNDRVATAEQSVSTLTDEVSAEAAARLALAALVDNNAAAIVSEQIARTSADSAEASARLALDARLTTAESGVSGNASAISGIDTRVTAAESGIDANASDITALDTRLTTAEGDVSGNATAISGLDTRVTTAEGNINTNASDITALETTVNDPSTGVAATAGAVSSLDTRVSANEDDISTQASSITQLSTTVNDPSTGLPATSAKAEQALTSIDGIHAQATLKLDVNGHVAGIGLASTTNDEGSVTSDFIVSANRFAFVFPSDPWQPNQAYTTVHYVKPTDTGTTFIYQCIDPGTSSGTEPVWPTQLGGTVADGDLVWKAVNPSQTVPFSIGTVDGQPAIVLGADLFSDGFIGARMLSANLITADMLFVEYLAAITSNLGHIDAGSMAIGGAVGSAKWEVDADGNVVMRSATSGARMEQRNNTIKVFDENGVKRVHIGDLSA